MQDTHYLVAACRPDHRMFAFPSNDCPSWFDNADMAHEAVKWLSDKSQILKL